MASDKLSSSVQESIVTAVTLINDDNSHVIANLIESDLFDQPLNDIITKSIEHRKQNKSPPGKAHIDDVFAYVLENKSHKQHQIYYDIIRRMLRLADQLDTNYLLTQVQDFIWTKRNRTNIGLLAERYQKSGPGTLDDIEKLYRDGLRIREDTKDYGYTLADNRAFDFLNRDSSDYCLINIPALDEHGVHPARKEMLAFLGARNKGKCIDGDSLILLPNGSSKTIRDVVINREPFILSFIEDKGIIVKSSISEFHENGIKDCWEITTVTGKSLVCTENHPLLTKKGWKIVGELTITDYITVCLNLPGLGKKQEITLNQARLLGYLIADGNLNQYTIGFTKTDPVIRDDFEKCVIEMGDRVTWNLEGHVPFGLITGNPKWSGSFVASWFSKIGLKRKKSKYKFIPDFLFEQTDEIICEFLKALFSCDGSIYYSQNHDNINTIDYSSASSELVNGIDHLLIRIGITAYKKYFTAVLNEKEFPGYAEITINNSSAITLFLDKIGFIGLKSNTVAEVRERISNLDYGRFPVYCRKFKYGPLGNAHTGKTKVSTEVMYEKIKSIEHIGKRDTYDITVPEHHNFIVNDIISHNSMWLGHCGKHALLKGWTIAHYTLENSAQMTSQRYFQSLFNGVKREGDYRYVSFIEDSKKNISLQSHLLKPDFIIERKDETITYLSKKVKDFRYKMENLRIREFPSGRLTFDMLEKDLDNLKLLYKFEPDIILLDSPQLMRMDRRREGYLSLDELVTDLRGLAVDRNLSMCITQQGNRSADKADTVHDYHGSGSIGVFNIADNGLTYSQTESEEKHSTARLHAQKVRNDSARFTVCITQHYASGQFCMDSRLMSSSLEDIIKSYIGVDSKDLEIEDDDLENNDILQKVR